MDSEQWTVIKLLSKNNGKESQRDGYMKGQGV